MADADLDDTVDDLIAKGFTRVKAIRLFYENQKLKAQQAKEPQPLYHTDVPNMKRSDTNKKVEIDTVAPVDPNNDIPLSYTPSPRPSKADFDFDDAAKTEEQREPDPVVENLNSGQKPPLLPAGGLSATSSSNSLKQARDNKLHAMAAELDSFFDMGGEDGIRQLGNVSYDSEDSGTDDSRRGMPVSTPDQWTEEDERQVQLIMGTGLTRRRAMRKFLKLKQDGHDTVIIAGPVRVTELDAAGEAEVDRLIDGGMPAQAALRHVLDKASAAATLSAQQNAQAQLRGRGDSNKPAQHGQRHLMPTGANNKSGSSATGSFVSDYASDDDSYAQFTALPTRVARTGPTSTAARVLRRYDTIESVASMDSVDFENIQVRAAASAKIGIGAGNPRLGGGVAEYQADPRESVGENDEFQEPGRASEPEPEPDPQQEEQQRYREELLAEQLRLYGVDMMQSLTDLDDPIIDKMVEDGFSVDAAILDVFEQKVNDGRIRLLASQGPPPGRGGAGGSRQPFQGGGDGAYMQEPDRCSEVSYGSDGYYDQQQEPYSGQAYPSQPQQPYYSNGGSSQVGGSQVNEYISSNVSNVSGMEDDEELELELIMSRGHTRAEAIRIYLARKKQGGMVSASSPRNMPNSRGSWGSGGSGSGGDGGGQAFSPPVPQLSPAPARRGMTRSGPSKRMSYRWQARDEEELAMLQARGYSRDAALEIIGERINNDIANGELPESMPAPPPPARSPLIRSTSTKQAVGENFYSSPQPPQPPPQQHSPYGAPQHSPPQQYSPYGPPPPQQYSPYGPSSAVTAPPPHASLNDGTQRRFSSSSTTSSGGYVAPPPSTATPYGGGIVSGSPMSSGSRKMGGKSVSQEDLETALLLSEQEARFGTNMFEAMRPGDEELIAGMTANGNMRRNQAMKILFDSRYNSGGRGGSGPAGGYSAGTGPVGGYSDGYSGGRRASAGSAVGGGGHPAPAPIGGTGAARSTPQPEEDELEKVLRMSARESETFRPGVQKVEGFASRGGAAPHRPAPAPARTRTGPTTASESDIESLSSMGFPRNSAIDALERCNNDIGAAAEYLLGHG